MYCVIAGCTYNYRGEDVTIFFQFPKNEPLCENVSLQFPELEKTSKTPNNYFFMKLILIPITF